MPKRAGTHDPAACVGAMTRSAQPRIEPHAESPRRRGPADDGDVEDLSESVLESLRQQKVAQHRAKLATLTWQDNDLVFPTAEGGPRDHRRDARRWSELLEHAGVRYERLHAASHTAATLLLRGHVDTRTVMEIMGWNEERMATLHRHVIDDMRVHAADSVDRLMNASPATIDAEA